MRISASSLCSVLIILRLLFNEVPLIVLPNRLVIYAIDGIECLGDRTPISSFRILFMPIIYVINHIGTLGNSLATDLRAVERDIGLVVFKIIITSVET